MTLSCPVCSSDLADESDSYWCDQCEATVSYVKAAQGEAP
jgi:hypothetical protein